MGGHGHADPYKVPHPSIYKVENSWELKQVQESLARQGLRDPWLRNEVWRYDTKNFGKSAASRLRGLVFRGFVWGFAAFAITIGCEYAFLKDNGHGHGHGHGDAHHENTEGKSDH